VVMKRLLFVFAAFALLALVLFGCVEKPSLAAATAAATTGAGAIDSSLDSFDASLNEASGADSELDSTLPSGFDTSLLNES